MQARNKRLIEGYNILKLALGLTNNDPNGFTQLDAPALRAAKAATVIKEHGAAAAKKLQSVGPAVTGKLGVVSTAAKKVQQQATAGAQQLQSEAAAALKALRPDLSDEAQAAYRQIAAFYEGRVWHVVR